MSENKGIIRVGDSGVHTVEGTVAGRRAAQLTKEREKQQAEYELTKQKIKKDNTTLTAGLSEKFAVSSGEPDMLEAGLLTVEDVEEQRRKADEAKRQAAAAEERRKREREEKRKKASAALSFNQDGDGGEEGDGGGAGVEPVVKKVCKDPSVSTAFLPDRQRDAEIEAEKQRLTEEWLREQENIKNDFVEVVYSYWDGSGHRRELRIRKGTTVGRFLELVKQQLAQEFRELQSVSSDSLMYVKEDLIIPHHYSFYDLIVTKARGKSGPLFHFDVHDDVRLLSDARVEKDESHPGKIVERRWYEKNKHIFPASRWEVYDPAVVRDRYTIHGGEVQKK